MQGGLSPKSSAIRRCYGGGLDEDGGFTGGDGSPVRMRDRGPRAGWSARRWKGAIGGRRESGWCRRVGGGGGRRRQSESVSEGGELRWLS